MSQPPDNLPARDVPLAASPSERPKLSIAHLMLWTLGTAIVLAFSRAQFAAIGSAGPDVDEMFDGDARGIYLRILAVVSAPFSGVAVAFMIFALWRKYRGHPLPISQPGHWLLVLGGVSFFIHAANQFVQQTLLDGMGDEVFFGAGMLLAALAQAVTAGVLAGLSFWACRTIDRSQRWWLYFSANGAMYSLLSASVLLMVAAFAAEPIAIILAIVLAIAGAVIFMVWVVSFPWAVAGDLWHQERRDALHWAGVVVVLVNALATLALYVPLRFL
jgi:hypothetical protein